MTKRRKIILWASLVLSVPATYYAGVSVVYYAWLNAAVPERWPTDRAALWVYSALALTVFFAGVFVYSLVALIKDSNKQYHNETHAT